MEITLIDNATVSNPETVAMLMALYSRSNLSIKNRLQSLGENEAQIQESLKKYYLGYGHASIGDCGDASIFFEGLSMLAAKALEDNSLFNGQESSSRYINFGSQPCIDPLNSKQSSNIQREWIGFYNYISIQVNEHLRTLFPIQSNQSEQIYYNAINAKTFDICRAFLPAGVTTQVGVKMTFRSLLDHIWKLEQHPTLEVRSIAKQSLAKLIQQYPSTFKECSETNKLYYSKFSEKEFFLENSEIINTYYVDIKDNFNQDLIATIIKDQEIIYSRPKGQSLPSYYNSFGTMKINYTLDFGSWRDIQRHRNTLINKCTTLSDNPYFNFDYITCLPQELKDKIYTFIDKQYKEIKNLNCESKYELAYYYPLGNYVNAQLVLTFPELLYILELRSSKSVHFTLRDLINRIYNQLKQKYFVFHNYIDTSEIEFYYNRGNQTIFKKD